MAQEPSNPTAAGQTRSATGTAASALGISGVLLGAPTAWALAAAFYDANGREQSLGFVVVGLVAGLVGAVAGFAAGWRLAHYVPASSRRIVWWVLMGVAVALAAAGFLMFRF